MSNMESELLSFLRYSNQTNYFHYIHKNDGMVAERKEYILDLLLYSIFKSYVVFGTKKENSKVFEIIKEFMNQDFTNEEIVQETINVLKNKLFMVDLNVYNEAIEIIEEMNIDDTYFLITMENLMPATEKIKKIVSYLLNEMENLMVATRQRTIAC